MDSQASARRRILLVYPRFTGNNLLNYENMAPFYPGKRAVMPPLGLLAFAGMLDGCWDVRMVDENVRPLRRGDIEWAEIVAVSGMHPQRRRITAILEESNALGRITALGGPSANICPEFYPMAAALHIGEIGDATREMLEWLKKTRTRPRGQTIFRVSEKLPLDEQPLPRLDIIDPQKYLVMPMQFSVGCPFTCEFCDIPMIYGRFARIKSHARVVSELEAIYHTGFVGTILFVDDNLIANRKALRGMLEEVIAWQRRNGYPYPLTGEASLNLAQAPEILNLLQEAKFTHMFVGVESPDPATLKEISKRQNVLRPMSESLRTLQEHGLEVILGMIFGFDNDTAETGRVTAGFIGEVEAPIVYFNLLAALPKTPLWERMAREGRLLADESGDPLQSESLLACLKTNIAFKLPNRQVAQMLLDAVREVYSPEQVFRRFLWNAEHVYGRQVEGRPPARTWARQKFLLLFMLGAALRILRDIGWKAPYRGHFWRYARALLRLRRQHRIRGLLELLLRTAPNAHHLIEWARILLDSRVADLPRVAA